jgi:hypothetical protein
MHRSHAPAAPIIHECFHISRIAQYLCERGLKPTPVKGELRVFGFGRGVEVRLTFPPRINARETKKKNKKKKSTVPKTQKKPTADQCYPTTQIHVFAGLQLD